MIIPACETDDHLAAAAGHSVNPGRWLGLFDELMLRIGGEARQLGYVLAVAKSHRWLLVRRNLRTRELAFLPLLLTSPRPARHTGAASQAQMDHRGGLQSRVMRVPV